VPGPEAYAGACVHLLSPAGAEQRGRIHVPAPASPAATATA